MGSYSIKDLEQLSGVKAHTIRIWEQRYGLLHPNRTDTNIRTYNDEQVKKILQINVLYNHGVKISKIASLTDTLLTKEVAQLQSQNPTQHIILEGLTIALIEMEEVKFEEILNTSIQSIGFEKTMNEVIYPFLDRIGVLWLTDVINPAQEHFMSNLIRQKIVAAIDDLGPILDEKAKIGIAFLHEEEMHEIGLLYHTYILKKRGLKIVYLGQMVPYKDLLKAAKVHPPDFLLTSFVKSMEEDWLERYVSKIILDFPKSRLLVGGFSASNLRIEEPNFNKISSISKLQEIEF